MRSLRLVCVGTLALALAAGGCSDEDKERKACPAGGLGVTSETGTKCSTIKQLDAGTLKNCNSQIEAFDDYNCTKPQICPDQGSFRNIYFLDPTWQGDTINFAISNCSVGSEKLTISKVELLGDSRCSFEFDESVNVTSKVVESGGPEQESSLIQVLFKPTKLGQDHAALKITTNAQNYPTLILPICFKVIPKYAPAVDGGPTAIPEAGAPSLVKSFICNDVSTTPRSCP
jgi:hypothetical protein